MPSDSCADARGPPPGPGLPLARWGNVGRLLGTGGKCRSSFVPTARVGRALMMSCAVFL